MAGYNRFGGFGGGANMQNMIRQAQKMQAEMQKKNEELANTEIIGAYVEGRPIPFSSRVFTIDASVKRAGPCVKCCSG